MAQLKQLQDAKTPISANAIIDPAKYGLEADFINNHTNELAGKLMADWAVTQGGGEVVLLRRARALVLADRAHRASSASSRSCAPSCKARYVDIPIGEIGKSAPSRVVSDLQAHPEHEGRRLRHGRSRHGPARRAEVRAAGR